MISLTIDCTSNFCSAALLNEDDDDICVSASEEVGTGHAERLLPMIETLLHEAGAGYRDIGWIACSAGPGSFTGVRIGLATARGLGLGLSVPVYGLSSLAALRASVFEGDRIYADRPILVVSDARRGHAFCQYFDGDGLGADPFLIDFSNIDPNAFEFDPALVLCGSAAKTFAAKIHHPFPIAHCLPVADIETQAKLATCDPMRLPPTPIYVRPPDAKPQTGFAVARR